ncbi:MAG TPA: AEC family transporter [Rhodospirillaceae bacterium]|nr:transporter [Alphaproteobacteria bacterium]MAS47715.1 transporter [Alphaproteobacteria bacterium]MBN51978.1 transporter [Alphaproteobacteria bacterium]OUT40811.1 MAG: transporter [Micavibrio sp. TMED2]HCI46378.1 AEC family transporter [Rhodospirillaceae bacterium]|tara:strand:+ start:13230 stop:14216 length:987 start_codon:yes stop_codon:yes gene_type:complete
MDVVVNVVAPVFAIIIAGWIAARAGLLGRDGSTALNQFVYWFSLPPVLFLGLARAPLSDIFNGPFLAAFLGGLFLTYLVTLAIGWVVWPRTTKPDLPGTTGQNASMMALNASFSNTGYMGIPLFIALVGNSNLAPVIIATVIMSAVMVAVAIIMLEALGKSDHSKLKVALGIGKSLIKNPLIMSSVAGLIAAFIKLPIPDPIQRFGDLMGAAAGPCALFAIGLFLAGQNLKEGLGNAFWVSVMKLALQPIVTLVLIDCFFPMDPYWRASALVLAALPTGALTFVVAQRYQIHVGETSTAILVSTVLSIMTLSGILIALAPVFQKAVAG